MVEPDETILEQIGIAYELHVTELKTIEVSGNWKKCQMMQTICRAVGDEEGDKLREDPKRMFKWSQKD